MSGAKIRMTTVVMDILDVLMQAPTDDPPWGLILCEMTGRGTGTVYPALDRLLKVGWVEDRWEDPPPDRPARRFYHLTSAGREAYAAELQARNTRRAAWRGMAPRTGDT